MEHCDQCNLPIAGEVYQSGGNSFCCPLHVEEFYHELSLAKGRPIEIEWPKESFLSQKFANPSGFIGKPA